MKSHTSTAIIIILIITLLATVQRCHFNLQNATSNYNALTDSITYFKNRDGTQSASIKTLNIDKAQLQQTLLAKDKQLASLAKQFSQIKTVVQYSQLIKFDTITISYKDTVPCAFNRFGKINTKWYRFNYTTNNKGVTIDSLTINNQATVITGFKRSWFLGKETLTSMVTNTNPNIAVTTLTSVQVVVPVPWYKRWYVWLGAGIIGGMLTQ